MTDKIQKFLDKLDKKTRNRILEKIRAFLGDPKGAHDIKKMKGYETLFRLRLGDIRVLLLQNPDTEKFTVVDIDFRGNIY